METLDRKDWMSVLAKADAHALESSIDALGELPEYSDLREAETGLVMVRGRTGGVGNAFNLGEMTVTRGAIRLASGETGLSYVAGRNKNHARLAAVVDAMMQSGDWRDAARTTVVEPLAKQYDDKVAETIRQRAATRVDFFTMTRDREDKK